ncbi:MAG: hypothetical protein D6754_14335 [Alphaproteobacteria bacterium]|nr:MAG: hypothetical protein D6754_14335 [Alphaproteobacteria bacterium]
MRIAALAVSLMLAAALPAAAGGVVEIYRPSTLLVHTPVSLEADGRPLGVLRPGERMRCRFDHGVTLRVSNVGDRIRGRSLHVAHAPALVRLGVELSSLTLTAPSGGARFVADLSYPDRSDKTVFGTERASIVREVPCGQS